MYEDVGRYQAFWRRVGATIIDFFLVYVPFTLAGSQVAGDVDNAWDRALVEFAFAIPALVYSGVLLVWNGQTVGRKLMDIRVVDARTLGPIRWHQALRREAWSIAFAFQGAVGTVFFWEAGIEAPMTGGQYLFTYWSWLMGVLWAGSRITFFTNDRRRTLDDFLARTVVVKANYRVQAPPPVSYYSPHQSLNAREFRPPVLPPRTSNRS